MWPDKQFPLWVTFWNDMYFYPCRENIIGKERNLKMIYVEKNFEKFDKFSLTNLSYESAHYSLLTNFYSSFILK